MIGKIENSLPNSLQDAEPQRQQAAGRSLTRHQAPETTVSTQGDDRLADADAPPPIRPNIRTLGRRLDIRA